MKARHFVLALRDFFHEQLEERKLGKTKTPTTEAQDGEQKVDGQQQSADEKPKIEVTGDTQIANDKPPETGAPESTEAPVKSTELDVVESQPVPVVVLEPEVVDTQTVDDRPKADNAQILEGNPKADDTQTLDVQPKSEAGTQGAAAAMTDATSPGPPDGNITNDEGTSDTKPVPAVKENDDLEWTLDWITITRLQPIIEAFDDDASGFITVAEVNKFTTSRPRNWR